MTWRPAHATALPDAVRDLKPASIVNSGTHQSSSIQSETRTPVSMADVEHISSEQPRMMAWDSCVRRYSALVWTQVTPPPGLDASSLGIRSRTTGCTCQKVSQHEPEQPLEDTL